MKLLVQQGRLPADHPVPVLVEPRAEAQETSLSENLHRVAMNPVDELAAYAEIVDQQTRRPQNEQAQADPVAYTARRFGVTRAHVEGRLRLAALCPEVLEALKDGTITLESAKAYGLTADHALQARVFAAQAKSNWKPHDPRLVRDVLRGITLDGRDRLPRFIGLDAYRAAGGRVEIEMYMGAEAGERWIDVALVQQLAQAKLEAMVPDQAQADGFAHGMAMGLLGHDKWPKTPDGFEQLPSWNGDQAAPPRDQCIGVYTVEWPDDDNGGSDADPVLGLRGLFIPAVAEEEGGDGGPGQRADADDWEAQRRESARQRRIRIGDE